MEWANVRLRMSAHSRSLFDSLPRNRFDLMNKINCIKWPTTRHTAIKYSTCVQVDGRQCAIASPVKLALLTGVHKFLHRNRYSTTQLSGPTPAQSS